MMMALASQRTDIRVILYGAFHHVNSSNPRYKLNTSEGRFDTLDESISPNEFVSLINRHDVDEPMWDNAESDVILTVDAHWRVVAIREAENG